MKKTKIIKTTYQLTPIEIVRALKLYLKETLKLSDDIDRQSVEFAPILGENTELIGMEIEFERKDSSVIVDL